MTTDASGRFDFETIVPPPYAISDGQILRGRSLPGDTPTRLPAAAFTSGRTHHELFLIEVGPDAAPIPEGRRVGMYHFGLKVGESDDELREAQQRLAEAGVAVVGASDHTVTHSLYILNPDGNEVELCMDVQPEVWPDDPAAIFSPIKPLQL